MAVGYALVISRLPVGNATGAVVLSQNDFGRLLASQARLASAAA